MITIRVNYKIVPYGLPQFVFLVQFFLSFFDMIGHCGFQNPVSFYNAQLKACRMSIIISLLLIFMLF